MYAWQHIKKWSENATKQVSKSKKTIIIQHHYFLYDSMHHVSFFCFVVFKISFQKSLSFYHFNEQGDIKASSFYVTYFG